MITQVTCSKDMRQALNENLHGLLTGKRKAETVKEVNNTLGKLALDVAMELKHNQLIGSRSPLSWYDRNMVSLPSSKNPLKLQVSNGNGKKKKAA